MITGKDNILVKVWNHGNTSDIQQERAHKRKFVNMFIIILIAQEDAIFSYDFLDNLTGDKPQG
jgi:hypothetical protein